MDCVCLRSSNGVMNIGDSQNCIQVEGKSHFGKMDELECVPSKSLTTTAIKKITKDCCGGPRSFYSAYWILKHWIMKDSLDVYHMINNLLVIMNSYKAKIIGKFRKIFYQAWQNNIIFSSCFAAWGKTPWISANTFAFSVWEPKCWLDSSSLCVSRHTLEIRCVEIKTIIQMKDY